MNKKIKLLALTLLITGAIDSIRNLPGAAIFGSSLVFFFIFAAILFLIPSALVSAELAANISEGGIYQWGRLAFGERIGFLCVWLQWVNNFFWFPSILSFIAGTAAYLVNPALAQNHYYLVFSILGTFWGLTLINLRGIHLSSKFTSFCAFAGLIVPITLIIALLGVWFALGKPLQMHLTITNIFPDLTHLSNWVTLTIIMLGFIGIELATVHIKEVATPQTTFPRALAISTIIILVTMMLGSLAIAYVLPYNQINLVNGTIETFAYFLSAYHLNWMIPILTILIVIGSLGGVISWVISPIRGIAQASKHGFLPEFFQRENKYGVAQNLLITQAILVSIICLVFLLLPTVSASYWLLSALSTELSMIMYIVMFFSAFKLRNKINYSNQRNFKIPGKKPGMLFVCCLGMIGCGLTFLVGFIPPDNVNIAVGSKFLYEFLFCSGLLAMLIPVLFFFICHKKSQGNKSVNRKSYVLETGNE